MKTARKSRKVLPLTVTGLLFGVLSLAVCVMFSAALEDAPQKLAYTHTAPMFERHHTAAAVKPPRIIDYKIPAAMNGLAPVVTRLETSQPVVFLTIDDGAYKES